MKVCDVGLYERFRIDYGEWMVQIRLASGTVQYSEWKARAEMEASHLNETRETLFLNSFSHPDF